jgi:hypothetical protein
MIPKKDSMRDSHGPKGCVSKFWPVHSRMKDHGPADGHNCLDSSLSMPIMMVRSNPCKAIVLMKCREMIRKLLGGKSTTIVR